MLKIKTANIKYAGDDRLDITVKSADERGKILTPTWNLVFGYKKRKYYAPLTEDQYTELYLNLLRDRYLDDKSLFLDLLKGDSITLCCYCHDGAPFCHRYIAAQVLYKIAKYHNIECGVVDEAKAKLYSQSR